MTPLRERNPIPIGIIGVGAIVLLLFGAFHAQSLPLIGGGTTYAADFTDSANLQPNNDVRVAGVKVGQITSVTLDTACHARPGAGTSACVRIKFRINGISVGPQSRADIRIKTLLGEKYIALTPLGSGKQRGDIPLSRTSTPLDVTTAFIGLSRHIEAIDTPQLTQAFNTLAATFSNTAPNAGRALRGLAKLSTTIASRDAQLATLLGHSRDVTGVLADRDAQFVKLLNDADLVLRTVQQERAVIHQLLVDTAAVSTQLTGLVQENRSRLAPALRNLQSVVQILNRNQTNLDHAITLLAPFVRDFTNTLGTGRWFDTFIQNIAALPTFKPAAS